MTNGKFEKVQGKHDKWTGDTTNDVKKKAVRAHAFVYVVWMIPRSGRR